MTFSLKCEVVVDTAFSCLYSEWSCQSVGNESVIQEPTLSMAVYVVICSTLLLLPSRRLFLIILSHNKRPLNRGLNALCYERLSLSVSYAYLPVLANTFVLFYCSIVLPKGISNSYQCLPAYMSANIFTFASSDPQS